MNNYLNKVRNCINAFMKVEFIQVPKRENGEADSLAKVASVEDIIDKKIEIRYIPSVDILQYNR